MRSPFPRYSQHPVSLLQHPDQRQLYPATAQKLAAKALGNPLCGGPPMNAYIQQERLKDQQDASEQQEAQRICQKTC